MCTCLCAAKKRLHVPKSAIRAIGECGPKLRAKVRVTARLNSICARFNGAQTLIPSLLFPLRERPPACLPKTHHSHTMGKTRATKRTMQTPARSLKHAFPKTKARKLHQTRVRYKGAGRNGTGFHMGRREKVQKKVVMGRLQPQLQPQANTTAACTFRGKDVPAHMMAVVAMTFLTFTVFGGLSPDLMDVSKPLKLNLKHPQFTTSDGLQLVPSWVVTEAIRKAFPQRQWPSYKAVRTMVKRWREGYIESGGVVTWAARKQSS